MAFRWSLLFVPAALVASIQMSAAATLHWPLPANSTEVNGVQQTLTSRFALKPQPVKLEPPTPVHPHAAAGLRRIYQGKTVSVTRYHNDNYPTGWNSTETDLTPATVGSPSFGLLTTLNVDGNVLAQPLLVSNFTMPDNTVHDVLIVATGHDTIYAYDAQTYAILWQVSLGTYQSTNDVGCGDIQGGYGISSTPVIVRTKANAATIYVVAATEPAHLSFHTQLHALDLGTGQDIKAPVEIDPQTKLKGGTIMHFDPQNQWNRASLAYNNGSLYVGIGSHCDNNAGGISGWLLRYDAKKLKLVDKFNTIEAPASYELSSVWMSGYSPAIGPDGKVYAITGNGNYSLHKGQIGYGESILGLADTLDKKQVDTFTPSNWQDLNNGDSDFGSGGAMLVPTVSGQSDPPLILGEGKAGTIYVLNASSLGGLQGGSSQPIQTISGGGCWCGPAYYVGPNGGVVFYQSGGDVLRAYSVDPNNATTPLSNTASGSSGAGGTGSFPVVSSNGSTAGTGVVWLINRGNPTETLEAYNAETLGAPIYSANAGSWSNGSRSYLSPLVANGRVYAGSKNSVTVFGLTD